MTTYCSLIFLLSEVIKTISPQRLCVCLHISPCLSQRRLKQGENTGAQQSQPKGVTPLWIKKSFLFWYCLLSQPCRALFFFFADLVKREREQTWMYKTVLQRKCKLCSFRCKLQKQQAEGYEP